MNRVTPASYLLVLALAAVIWTVQASAQKVAPGSTDPRSSRQLVLELIEEARQDGIPGNPQGVSPREIELGVARLGVAVLPGALEILQGRSEDSDVLEGLLRGVVEVGGLGDPRVCEVIREYLKSHSRPDGTLLARAALGVLRIRSGACHDAIEDIGGLLGTTEDRPLRLDAIEILGWIGQTPEDLQLVLDLAGDATDPCERRLIAATGLRILDRVMPASQPPL